MSTTSSFRRRGSRRFQRPWAWPSWAAASRACACPCERAQEREWRARGAGEADGSGVAHRSSATHVSMTMTWTGQRLLSCCLQICTVSRRTPYLLDGEGLVHALKEARRAARDANEIPPFHERHLRPFHVQPLRTARARAAAGLHVLGAGTLVLRTLCHTRPRHLTPTSCSRRSRRARAASCCTRGRRRRRRCARMASRRRRRRWVMAPFA